MIAENSSDPNLLPEGEGIALRTMQSHRERLSCPHSLPPVGSGVPSSCDQTLSSFTRLGREHPVQSRSHARSDSDGRLRQ